MAKINEDIKPTLREPVGTQSKNFEKNFKRTMNANGVKLNEVDGLLTEKEFSLKKKIFTLPKMEALVFADPKLLTVYNEMSEEGEEKYGYHYNETIMNMIFNDYVLHDPKYLEKYKMAIPKEKKRRDKSGINQAKKAGEETMKKMYPEFKPKEPTGLPKQDETTGSGSSGAYAGPAAWKKGGDLMEEPKVVDETTSAGSAGGAAGYVGYAGPAAWGSGDLLKKGKTSPALRKPIWKGGTVIQESEYLTDPTGFETFVNMLNEEHTPFDDFIIDKTSAFSSDVVKGWNKDDSKLEYDTVKTGKLDNPNFKTMEENDIQNDLIDFDIPAWALPALINADMSGLSDEDEIKLNNFVNKVQAKYGNANFMLGDIDGEDNLGFRPSNDIDNLGNDVYRLYIKPNDMQLDEKAKSQQQQKFMGMVHAIQKGELSSKEVSPKMKKAAKEMSPKDVEDFASTKHKGLPEKVDEEFNVSEYVVTVKHDNGTARLKVNASSEQAAREMVMKAENCPARAIQSVVEKKKIAEDATTMANASKLQSREDSMANKMETSIPIGTQATGGMNESDQKLLEELNKELEAFSVHHNKLKVMAEDRKPSALVLRDRMGSENEKNFKKDLGQSGTKEIIDIEKELQYKDQQTDVKDPQKLGTDIEKKEIKSTDAEGDEHLKNVGDSTNDKGDEIPKRNLTSDEQHEVDMMRLGQHSLVYDNKPSQRFEDRMKADMGDDIYKMRQDQMEFRSKAPTYNKDNQPVQDGEPEKDQFNKEKATWNKQTGVNESVVTGKYYDILGKRRIMDFKLNETLEIVNESDCENYSELNFDGLGNSYDSKVSINEGVVNVLKAYKFYTDGSAIYRWKTPAQNLNENVQKGKKPVMNEQFEKFKHLTGYKPETFVDTKATKKNRGF